MIITDGGEVIRENKCKWWKWIGANCCDDCGNRNLAAHDGIVWHHGGDKVHVLWRDYGPGRDFNVPLLTHYIGEESLKKLQEL